MPGMSVLGQCPSVGTGAGRTGRDGGLWPQLEDFGEQAPGAPQSAAAAGGCPGRVGGARGLEAPRGTGDPKVSRALAFQLGSL